MVAPRRIIPAHHGNLLNVTMRAVEEDCDLFLRFADQRMLAVVMLFQQQRSAADDDAMRAMTRDLIDAALMAASTPTTRSEDIPMSASDAGGHQASMPPPSRAKFSRYDVSSQGEYKARK